MSYLYKGFLVVYHRVCLTRYFSQCLNLQGKEIKSFGKIKVTANNVYNKSEQNN